MSSLNAFGFNSQELPIGTVQNVTAGGTTVPDIIASGGSVWLRSGREYPRADYPELASQLGSPDGLFSRPFAPTSYNDFAWTPTRSLYVTVGNAGAVNTTTDLITWNTITVGTATWTSVTYGSDKFVAGGRGGKLAYSSNGTDWTVIDAQDNTVDVVAVDYANNLYFYKDDSGQIYTSTNGTNWVQTGPSASPKSSNNYNNFNYYGEISKYVLLGYDTVSTLPIVYTSTDAANWTKSILTGATTVTGYGYFGYNGILYVNGKYYVADAGRVHSTTDFTTWTTVTSGFAYPTANNNYLVSYSPIIHDGTKFLHASNTYLSTSTNGTTWTVQSSWNYRYADGLVYFPNATTNKYVLTGPGRSSTSGYPMYFTSTDGNATWTDNSTNNVGPYSYGITIRKSANNSTIIAGVNSANTTCYSYNGLKWFTGGLTLSTVYAFKYLNDAFFVTHSSGVHRSSDGINWTQIIFSQVVTDITYGNGKYFAASNNSAPIYIYSSTDGINWTVANPTISNIFYIQTVAAGGGEYAVFGQSGGWATSTDLSTWTTKASFTNTVYSITYASNLSKWVVGDRYSYIWTSTTLSGTWTYANTVSTGTPWAIEYKSNPGLFIIAGTNYYQTTTDFVTYSTTKYIASSAYSATYNFLLGQVPGTRLLAVPHTISGMYTPGLLDIKDLNNTVDNFGVYFADFQTVGNTVYANLKTSYQAGSSYVGKRISAYAYTTDNGDTWSIKDLPLGASGIKYTGGVWVTYAYSGGTVYTSTDLSSWSTVVPVLSDIRDVSYLNGTYRVYGAGGAVFVGTPGSMVSFPNSVKSGMIDTIGTVNNYRKSNIRWFNNKYIEYTCKLVGGTNTTQILTSTDGVAWNSASTNLTISGGTAFFTNIKVLADNKLYLKLSQDGGSVYSSTDGTTFQGISFTGGTVNFSNHIGDYYYDSSNLKYYLISPKLGIYDLGSTFQGSSPTLIRTISTNFTVAVRNYSIYDYYNGNFAGFDQTTGGLASKSGDTTMKSLYSRHSGKIVSNDIYFAIPGSAISSEQYYMETPATNSNHLSVAYVKAK